MRMFLTLLFSVVLWACSSQAPVRFKPMRDFQRPSFETFQLSNGLQVFFKEDPELPLVNAAFYFRGGEIYDSPSSVGLAGAMGSLMREGGAGTLSAAQLDAILEENAISISSQLSDENGVVSVRSLSSDFELALKLFADVLIRPRFEESRLNLVRKQSAEAIRRRKDDSVTVANISFDQLIYGDSVYGKQLEEKDLGRLSVSALRREHAMFVTPHGNVLTVSGAITKARLLPLLEEYIGNWKADSQPALAVPELKFHPTPGVYFVPLPVNQTTVLMGEQGIRRFSPDASAIEVFNRVISGGFGSRLTSEIRTNRGLAYQVEGGISPYVVAGMNYIFFQSKSASVADGINAAADIVSSLKAKGVTDEELSMAKDAIESSYVFKFDRASDVVNRQAVLRMLNYPSDYDAHYLRNLRAVDLVAVNQVAMRYFDLSKFVIVVVGDEAAYNQLLEARSRRDSMLGALPLVRVSFDQVLRLR